MNSKLYSIGYATKPIEQFLMQLRDNEIDALADVRSVPYSKAFYDYHREVLITHLKRAQVSYVYLGLELGPRSKNDEDYDESGQVQFDRLMNSDLFLQGIERIHKGLHKGLNIALMCAEKDPISCHRSLLLGYYLKRSGALNVQHVLHNGETESQTELEVRMMRMHCQDNDMLSSIRDIDDDIELAWLAQVRLKAYRRPEG